MQNGDPFTYFQKTPLHVAEDITLDSGDLAGAVLHRATPIDVPTVAFRLLNQRVRVVDHPQVTGFSHVAERQGALGRRAPDRRCRSTATGSAT